MARTKDENKAPVDRGIMVGFWMPRDKHEEYTKILSESKVKDANGKPITLIGKLGEMLIDRYMSKKA